MKPTHYTIPIFIPQLACPFQCVFCDQKRITGHERIPSPDEVKKIIDEHLATIPKRRRHVEVGFFGGTFTGLPLEQQVKYLEIAQPYIEEGLIHGIRLSTRPDFINHEVLRMLKKHHIGTIELGAQSMDDGVLDQSGRGHTAADTAAAAAVVRKANFNLGLQMMIGLPGDTLEKSKFTAHQIVGLGADNTRIYPTLVIKDTPLEELYRKGSYKPLSLEEAVNWTKEIMKIFEAGNVRVIRVGLHPSEGLIDGSDLIAGPFHKSFRELVMTELWWDQLKTLMDNYPDEKSLTLSVPPEQLNFAVGYEAKNKKKLLTKYRIVSFQTDPTLSGRHYEIDHH